MLVMTKIDIFSGFLGAGKTTLIKKLIAEAYAGEKLVLIENEFGEIGIDGGFMKEAGIEVTEMNSGCICCSLVGDFTEALGQVLTTYRPDRILIEPSGVGKLSDVIRAVEKVQTDGVKLNAFTTVTDATKAKVYMKNFGEFYNDQIAHAGCIILSRTDGMAADKLAACVALLREKNEKATIVTTPWPQLTGSQLLAAMDGSASIHHALEALEAEEVCPECGHHHHHGEEHPHHEHHHEHHHHDHDDACHCHEHEHHHDETCHCHDHDHHHHHHHADEVFGSFGVETTAAFSPEAITAALAQLEDTARFGTVLRAKGIVDGGDGQWVHFDYVPGCPDVRRGCADVIGRLCVIGEHLNKAAVAALFGLSYEEA